MDIVLYIMISFLHTHLPQGVKPQRTELYSLACSLDDHNSTGQQARVRYWAYMFWGVVCRREGVLLPYFPPPPLDIKVNSYSRGLWHPAPPSTQETKHRAANLHHIKQSLNVSRCYTLPNETFMKGPLMRFQKHLVISLGAAERRSVDMWMNGLLVWELVKNDSMSVGAHGFIGQHVALADITCCFIH